MLGMVGVLRDFRSYRLVHTPRLPHHHLPQCIGSQKSLHAFSDAVPRMSTPGHLWCIITLPLWEVVTPSKLRIRLRSCANQRMSGISDMKEGIGIRPVIGLSCNLLLKRFGSNIRSQEAQSQLMSITQGQRLVRDYASQFETLLGRLDSYDESMIVVHRRPIGHFIVLG